MEIRSICCEYECNYDEVGIRVTCRGRGFETQEHEAGRDRLMVKGGNFCVEEKKNQKKSVSNKIANEGRQSKRDQSIIISNHPSYSGG